jgi:hypothetical protein
MDWTSVGRRNINERRREWLRNVQDAVQDGKKIQAVVR